MSAFLIFYVTGAAVYFLLRLLFRKSGVKVSALNTIWFSWLTCGEITGFIFGIFFWPIFAMISVLLWGGEILHINFKRKNAENKAEELKHATKYSSMKMTDLISEQKRLLDEFETKKQKKI